MRALITFIKRSMTFKYVITMRHGERSDYAGLKPKLHMYDPELTDKGKEQALEAGQLLKDYLFNDLKLPSSSRIVIVSSPFARTLQTSIAVEQGLFGTDNKQNIYVENRLSEYIDNNYNNQFPKSFLSLYTKSDILLRELTEEKLIYINDSELLPAAVEDDEIFTDRINGVFPTLIEKFLPQECDVLVLISHGSPVDTMNILSNYPGQKGWRNINYCSTYIYKYDTTSHISEFLKNIVPTKSLDKL